MALDPLKTVNLKTRGRAKLCGTAIGAVDDYGIKAWGVRPSGGR
jgi:hypothetical protein